MTSVSATQLLAMEGTMTMAVNMSQVAGPLVSVIMPAYNAEAYIARAIRSVLQQTLTDLELIIVDDNSSDRTSEVIAGCAKEDERIRFFRQPRNLGPSGARNAAISKALGEWIAMLDADDWYEPTRLQKLITAADQDQTPIAADNQRFIMAANGSGQQLLVDGDDNEPWRLCADDLLRGDRLHRKARNLGLLKPLIRSDFLESHNIHYDVNVAWGEDFYFLLQCLRHAPHMALVREPLYNYCIYIPQAQTKRLTMDNFLAIRTLHARHLSLFDPADFPVTARLMEQRRLDIEHYIRYQQFAEPLKRGRPGMFLKQLGRDPGGLLLLLRRVAGDPGAILLSLRYLVQHAGQRVSNAFRRFYRSEPK